MSQVDTALVVRFAALAFAVLARARQRTGQAPPKTPPRPPQWSCPDLMDG